MKLALLSVLALASMASTSCQQKDTSTSATTESKQTKEYMYVLSGTIWDSPNGASSRRGQKVSELNSVGPGWITKGSRFTFHGFDHIILQHREKS